MRSLGATYDRWLCDGPCVSCDDCGASLGLLNDGEGHQDGDHLLCGDCYREPEGDDPELDLKHLEMLRGALILLEQTLPVEIDIQGVELRLVQGVDLEDVSLLDEHDPIWDRIEQVVEAFGFLLDERTITTPSTNH